MKRNIANIIIIFTALSLSGCGIRSSLEIGGSGPDLLSLEVSVTGIALEYLTDVSEAQGVTLDDSIFVPEEIEAYFDALPGVTAKEVSTQGVGGLSLILVFNDISGFFAEKTMPDVPQIISIDTSGDDRTLSLTFQRDNMYQLVSILPFGEDPVSQSGMMLFENHGSKDEFTEMVCWLFEEYADAEEVNQKLEESLLLLNIVLPDTVETTNMKKTGDNSVELSIPLIDFFTLEEPLQFHVSY